MLYGFFNEINQRTYVCPMNNRDSSWQDHTWHNLMLKSFCNIIKPNISDYYAVSTIFDIKVDNEHRRVKFQEFSDVNMNNYNQSIPIEFQNFNCTSWKVNEFSDTLMKLLKKNLIIYYDIFTAYSCALKHLLRVPERVYHVNRFKIIGKNTRKNWKIIYNLLNKNNSSLSKNVL